MLQSKRQPTSPEALRKNIELWSANEHPSPISSPTSSVNMEELVNDYIARKPQVLYTPTKGDIIPCMIMFFCTLILITVAVVTYYLVDAQTQGTALNNLSLLGARGQFNVQYAVDSTRVFVNCVNSLFTVLNGNVDQTNQWLPFIFADDGFPDFIQRLYYVEYVPPSNLNAFLAKMNTQFTNYTITGRTDDGAVIPINMSQPFFLPVTRVSHAVNIPLLGFDHMSDTSRVPIIEKAMRIRDIVATAQILAAGGQSQVIFQYSPVYSTNSTQLLGFVVPLFTISRILAQSLTEFVDDALVSVIDLNTTDTEAAFMYNTLQRLPNGTLLPMTAATNSRLIREAPWVINTTINFCDRTWQLTFIPTRSFRARYKDNVSKWIGTIVSVIIWLICLGLCIFLFFFRRLRASMKDRQASEIRIGILSKFLPISFLSMIRCKSAKHFKPGSHRYGKTLIMGIVFENLDKLVRGKKSDLVMQSLNEFYAKCKTIINLHDGFIHRYEGTTFLAVFTSEQKGVTAASQIQSSLVHTEKCHIVMHSCTTLSGIMGDEENMLPALISDEIDVLKKLSMLCRAGEQVVLTREVLESLKKNFEKNVTFVGQVEMNGAHTDAYQLVENVDHISARRRFGIAIKKMVTNDYLGALDLLETLESDTETHFIQLRNTIRRTIQLCMKMAEVWNVFDTLGELDILRNAFMSFCRMEHSIPQVSAFLDIRDYKSLQATQRRQKAMDFFMTYCGDRDELRLPDHMVKSLTDKIDTEQFSIDFFDAILMELEFMTIEAHNRFKKSPMFLNGMYTIMTSPPV